MAKGGEVAGGPNDAKLKEAEKRFGKYKGTENERHGHPLIDAAVNLMGGSKATDKAQKGYAARRKHLVDKEVKKAE
ncbi:MAG: hypothetical protein DRI24_01670 [Deltaproteobacteria bacterium]|nr:MAG: hypothetical protein DRI24_01670 [Deltaproteobacteria bacterium]